MRSVKYPADPQANNRHSPLVGKIATEGLAEGFGHAVQAVGPDGHVAAHRPEPPKVITTGYMVGAGVHHLADTGLGGGGEDIEHAVDVWPMQVSWTWFLTGRSCEELTARPPCLTEGPWRRPHPAIDNMARSK